MTDGEAVGWIGARIDRITQPVFMINGKHDHLAPIGNIYFMLESGPPTQRTARVYADAGHWAFKYQSDWAPATFHWLETKLSADPTHE
jgi:pimeloyl-ACP methyl ester carboxylesterase